jgi:hypothetical protein
VTKGTLLREGQRLETGPGAYAQLKVGPAAELAVSERGQVRFDQKSVGGRDLIILDQGRIRMIGGEAIGKVATRALELRTADGTFALKGADVEVKKLGTQVAGSNLTYLKVNNGNASLRSGQTEISIPKEAVQGVTGGKVIAGQTFSLNEVALPPAQGTKPAIGPGTTLTVQPVPVAGLEQTPFPVVKTPATLPTIAISPVTDQQLKPLGICTTCLAPPPPATVPTGFKSATIRLAGGSTSDPAPTTETLNTTLSVILAPTTTFSTATTSPTTTTTTTTSTLSTSTLSTTTCLSCTSLITTSPTTTTTTSTTTTSGTLSTTKLTSTTLTLSSTSLLLK